MTPFFRKKAVSREQVMESLTGEHPISHLPIPDIDPNRSMGQGFNIVKMIEEHAPVRIKGIEEELELMQRKMVELTSERDTLIDLLTVLGKYEHQ